MTEQSNAGLISQAHKKNGWWKKWVAVFLLCVLGWWIWNTFFSGEEASTESTYTLETVEKGDLSIVIEGDGNVGNMETIDLFFGQSGTVAEVLVEEGESVKKGEKLARLKTQELMFEVEKAKISLATAQANLNKTLAGSTPEDITVARKNVVTSQFDLQSVQQKNNQDIQNALLALEEAEKDMELAIKESSNNGITDEIEVSSAVESVNNAQENLRIAKETQQKNSEDAVLQRSQEFDTAYSVYQSSLSSLDAAMQEARLILEIDDGSGYGMGYLFSAQDDQLRRSLLDTYERLDSEMQNQNITSRSVFEEENLLSSLELLEKRKTLLADMRDFMTHLSQGLDKTITSSTVTALDISSIKTSVLQKESSISTQITALLSSQQSLENIDIEQEKQALADENAILQAEKQLTESRSSQGKLSSTQDTSALQNVVSTASAQRKYDRAKIDYETLVLQSEINTSLSQTKIEIAQSQLENLQNSPRAVDTAVLRQQIENAQVVLDQAEYRLSQAYLIAPFDGVLLSSSVEVGDNIQSSSAEPHMVLNSGDMFQMNTNVEEAEIARIAEGQKAVVYFDALEDVYIDGVVSFISPTASTDANGVVTYRVEIDMKSGKEEGVREGMTAYAQFIIAESKDTLIIPLSALSNTGDGSFVLLETGEKQNISTGLTDGKKVEVLSGLKEGDEVRIGE